MIHIDELRRKNWLISFIRYVKESFNIKDIEKRLHPYKNLSLSAQIQRWQECNLRERGFAYGVLHKRLPDKFESNRKKMGIQNSLEKGEFCFYNMLFHQIEMLFELSVLLDARGEEIDDYFNILIILSAHAEKFEEGEHLFDLSMEDWGEKEDNKRQKLAQEVGISARIISQALKEMALYEDNQPMLIFPLYQAIVYLQVHQLLAIAVSYFSGDGRIDRAEIEKITSYHYMKKVYILEVLIALARIDGHVCQIEKNLLNNVIALARLSKFDNQRLLKEKSKPLGLMNLEKIDDLPTKHFLFEQLKIQCFLKEDGINEDEEKFIHDFAEFTEIDEEMQLKIEAQALIFLERHPDLNVALSQAANLKRYQNYLTRKVELVIRDNMSKLQKEIQETKELVYLLGVRAHRKLTKEEEQKVKAQLIDICLSIPSLVIFSIPGGSILLPLVLKALPFNLLPSAFTEEDEKI